MNQERKSNMSYGFHHVALRVRDIEKSKKFYKEVLGFNEVIKFPHPWEKEIKEVVMLDSGDGNYLELFSNAPEDTIPNGAFFHVAFRADDVHGLYERVKAAGTPVAMEPKDILLAGEVPTTVRAVFFKGPDGEEIEFCQLLSGVKL